MPDDKASLLIVDDAPAILTTLSSVLTEIGYQVRTAGDGFTALAEVGRKSPDILISDLNMPGMSGFELLALVRKNFPVVRTIAMSGAFAGSEAPSGLAADAFYQKGSSIVSLLRILENMPLHERGPEGDSRDGPPAWILIDGQAACGEIRITISCPACLRTCSHSLNLPANHAWQGVCIHCQSVIPVAVVPSNDRAFEKICPTNHSSPSPASRGLEPTNCS